MNLKMCYLLPSPAFLLADLSFVLNRSKFCLQVLGRAGDRREFPGSKSPGQSFSSTTMGEGGRRSLSICTMGSNEAGSDDGLKDAGRGLDISMNHLSLRPSLVIDRRRFCQDDELDQCNIPTPTMKVGKGFAPLSVRGTFPTQDPGDGRRRCFTGMESNLTDDLPTPTSATTHRTASATTFKTDVTMSTASANVRKFHFGPSAGSLSTIRGTCDGDDGHYHGASSPNEVNSPHSPEHSPE